jgi:hypothetical protein
MNPMASTATLKVQVLADATQASAELDKAAGRMGKFKGAMERAALPAAIVSGVLIKLGADAVDSASRLEQAMGGVDAVFEDNAATVKKWASQSAESIGLAASEYATLATLIGSQFKNAGLPMDQVTAKTGDLIALGADLAAMYGGTTKDAVEALSSAFKGEFDPLDKYAASLSAAQIQAELVANGQDDLTGKALTQAKAMATLALITEKTADAHGAAAREQDTAAAKTAQLAATTEDLKAKLGTALLPVVVALTTELGDMVGFMSDNSTAVLVLAGVIGGLAVAVLAINAAFKVYRAITLVVTAATWLWNSALLANPLVLVVAALLVAVGVFGMVYQRSERVRRGVDRLWAAMKSAYAWIRSNWPLLLAIITGPIGIAVALVIKHWGKIRATAQTLLTWLKDTWKATWDRIKTATDNALDPVLDIIDKIRAAIENVIDAVGDLIGALGRIKVPKINLPDLPGLRAAPAAAPAVTARTAATGTTRAAGAAGVHITINGALDPEGVARQIQRLLAGHQRRIGVVAA